MTIRITWKRAVLALVGIVLAGLLFAWTGIFNVAATSGHWKVTEWFLHWTMRNSVQTHSYWTAPERVTTEQGLVSAAGHFKQSCAVCHGAPGVRPSPVMQAAMPPAPDLSVNARDWTDRHLYWILEHGVKYSGMPAWGARDRPDEIRRMTAFVRRLPDMTPAQYRALTEPTAAAPVAGLRQGVLASCVACHGADGRGRGQPDIPVLGGQRPGYLANTLAAYADGRRKSAVMGAAAATLTPAERIVLARHFAAMPGLGTTAPRGDPAALRVIAAGLPTEQLPACASCHAPGKPRYPVIAGQRAVYVAERLRQWHGDETIVDARKSQATMPVIARRIPEEMIDPIAAALAGE